MTTLSDHTHSRQWLSPKAGKPTMRGPHMCPWIMTTMFLSTSAAFGMASPTIAAGMAEWSVAEWGTFFGIAGIALASFAAGAIKFVGQIREMFAQQDKKLDAIQKSAEASIPIQQAEAIATRAVQNATPLKSQD